MYSRNKLTWGGGGEGITPKFLYLDMAKHRLTGMKNIFINKTALQKDACHPLANHMCFSGYHKVSVPVGWEVGPQVNNKFEQDSSDDH